MSDAGSANEDGETNGGRNMSIADSKLNQIFSVLANQRCRYTLHTLRQSDEDTVSVETLADTIITQDPAATDAERVQVQLHHHTLPHLSEANIIDYDPRTHMVRYHGDEFMDHILTII